MKLEKTVKKKQSKLHDNNFPANISAVSNRHLFSMSSLSKKKKKKKKRIVEWKLCQCWRNTFALCLVSFFDYLAIRKTSKILYFVKRQQPAKVTWTGVFLLCSPFLIPMRFISSAALCHNASVCLWTSCDYLFTTRNNISLLYYCEYISYVKRWSDWTFIRNS